MAKKQRLIVLNRTMSFANCVLIQIILFYLAFLTAQRLALTVGHRDVANLPLGSLIFCFSLSLGIMLIRYLPDCPLHRLKQRILFLLGRARISLPDLQLTTDKIEEGLIETDYG
jgi:hypothetical protein